MLEGGGETLEENVGLQTLFRLKQTFASSSGQNQEARGELSLWNDTLFHLSWHSFMCCSRATTHHVYKKKYAFWEKRFQPRKIQQD